MLTDDVRIALGEEKVQVVATFQMHNLGAASTVAMGYPLGAFETALHDFAVRVNGEPVNAVRTQPGGAPGGGPVPRGGFEGAGRPGGAASEAYRFEGPYRAWKVFDRSSTVSRRSERAGPW